MWLHLFVPALTGLIKAASYLKKLTLAFRFHLNMVYISKATELIYTPPSQSARSTYISLRVRAICHEDRSFDATFFEIILSALIGCLEVNQLS